MATIQEALLLAQQYLQAGNLSPAEEICRRVIEVAPANSDALWLLAYICQSLGKLPEAVARYQEVLRYKPNQAEVHNNLGNALRELGRSDEAVASLREAVRLKPEYSNAHFNLGNALRQSGQLETAVACFHEALRLKPDHPDSHLGLGAALTSLGKLDEAVASCRQALDYQPAHAEALNGLGTALTAQGKLADGLECFQAALRLKQEFAEAHENMAMTLLLMGNFAQGWPEYEWRWKTAGSPPPPFWQPLWDGSYLAGRSLLLYAEQGLGDTLQFIRYAPMIKQRGATVLVQCQEVLAPLLSTCAGVDQVIPYGAPLPAFDVHAPLLSLPGKFGTTLTTVPAGVPYLKADEDLVEQWRQDLNGDGFKVGITWQGNPQHQADRHRSYPLTHFASLAAIEGVKLFSLQKGAGSEQVALLGGQFPLTDLAGKITDFMQTAAVVKNLDLVISADTAVAHLAAALGVPVWVNIPFSPDWRWLRDREDSPWYPTMRLFRQRAVGDWGEVFQRLSKALRERVTS